MTDLQRITLVVPAYDCIRNPCKFDVPECKTTPGRNHGIHNAELHMGVRGPSAEVTLVINTGWDLPSVPNYVRQRTAMRHPIGSYIEFHTSAPQHEDHQPSIRLEMRDDDACKTWDNCYFDRGYLMAEYPATLLVTNGSEAVWEWLEMEHDRIVAQMLTA